jgi:hypothetical protein
MRLHTVGWYHKVEVTLIIDTMDTITPAACGTTAFAYIYIYLCWPRPAARVHEVAAALAATTVLYLG